LKQKAQVAAAAAGHPSQLQPGQVEGLEEEKDQERMDIEDENDNGDFADGKSSSSSDQD
jgi:hypothetical protein